MRRRLLLIDAGPTLPVLAPRHGDFDRWCWRLLEGPDSDWTVVRPFLGEALPAPSLFAAALMTGNHAGARPGPMV